MISKYNKFFIQTGEAGCSNLIYWDKETNVKGLLKLNNVLVSKIIMKIKLIQPEILIVGRNIKQSPEYTEESLPVFLRLGQSMIGGQFEVQSIPYSCEI